VATRADLVKGDGEVAGDQWVITGQKVWTSLAETIYGGSDEFQRNIIASRALGLPRPEKP
jgi:alkylation response protein AidB-like acyl-CoA dehydrogenase